MSMSQSPTMLFAGMTHWLRYSKCLNWPNYWVNLNIEIKMKWVTELGYIMLYSFWIYDKQFKKYLWNYEISLSLSLFLCDINECADLIISKIENSWWEKNEKNVEKAYSVKTFNNLKKNVRLKITSVFMENNCKKWK